MKVIDFIQINDWDIKPFLIAIFLVQLLLISSIISDYLGMGMYLVREIISFIYLMFVPGILIIRIIDLHRLGVIRTILFSFGLSILSIMFLGVIINSLLPPFGIVNPISSIPVISAITLLVFLLMLISYITDNGFSEPHFIDLNQILNQALFFILFPLLAIFGAYYVNFSQNNIILVFLIVVISLVTLIVGFTRIIHPRVYPLVILVLGLSLVYAHSLISMYLVGNDIQGEYLYSSGVLSNSLWTSTIGSNINSMLSTTIFPPIFSIVSGLDLIWFYKVVYPFLLALQVLGLYVIYREQTNEKIAFLSCFLFMSVFMFYRIMISQTNQLMGQFFMILLIMLLIDKKIQRAPKSILFIIFSICMVLVYFLSSRTKKTDSNRLPNFNLVLIYTFFCLMWYIYISSSSPFVTLVKIGDHISSSLVAEFLSPNAAQGMELIMTPSGSFVGLVNKYLHIFIQFLITVGIISVFFHYKTEDSKFDKKYIYFSGINFIFCIASIAVPYFSSAIATSRLYFITLIFLSPYSIFGLKVILNKIFSLFQKDRSINNSIVYKVASILFISLLLLDSGLINELTTQNARSFSLSQNTIQQSSNRGALFSLYTDLIPERDVFSSQWISSKVSAKSFIYATYIDIRVHSLTSFGGFNSQMIQPLTNTTVASGKSYLYLQSINVQEGLGNNFNGDSSKISPYNISDNNYLMKNSQMIYSNGGSMVYYFDYTTGPD